MDTSLYCTEDSVSHEKKYVFLCKWIALVGDIRDRIRTHIRIRRNMALMRLVELTTSFGLVKDLQVCSPIEILLVVMLLSIMALS